MSNVLIEITDDGGLLPTKAYQEDAGWDLYVSQDTWARVHGVTDVSNGFRIAMPTSHWGLLIGRSSTAKNHGVNVITSVIDPGYTGPMYTMVQNFSGKVVKIRAGWRISQLVLIPVNHARLEQVDSIDRVLLKFERRRGTRATGSSGL